MTAAAANLNGAHAPEGVPGGAPPECMIDGFRIPKGTAVWRCFRKEKDGDTRLGYGKHPNGMVSVEWPIEEFSLETVAQRWGAGVYRIQWYAHNPEGRPLNRGKSPDFRIAPPDEVTPPEVSSLPTSAAPPNAGKGGRYCEACGGELAPVARFCSHCGTSQGGAGARAVAPMAAGLEGAIALAQALQTSFQAGQTNVMNMLSAVTERVRIESEERMRRYDRDAEERLQNARLAHDRQLQEQAATFQRVQATATGGRLKPEDIRGIVTEALEPVIERLDDLEEEDDDDDETPAVGVQAAEPGSLTEKVNAAERVIQAATPMVEGLAGKVIDALMKGKDAAGSASG